MHAAEHRGHAAAVGDSGFLSHTLISAGHLTNSSCFDLQHNLGAVRAQAAAQIGGAPPKAVQTQLCTIGDVFGKLQDITSNEECRSGCGQGECPPGWMPAAMDECNPQCGRVFEPFCAIALSLN